MKKNEIIFEELAIKLFDYYHSKFEYLDQNIIPECVALCESKKSKFNPEKGSQYSFYSTIIACCIRQHIRRLKYSEIRDRYVK